MTSVAPRPARRGPLFARGRSRTRSLLFARGLPFARRVCVLAAAAVSVAGCVSMPSSGAVGVISATPQSTSADGDVIEQLPAGPHGTQGPAEIVQGFLTASASYPANASIAREYLLSAVSREWNPGWSVTVFSKFNPYQQTLPSRKGHGGQVATVDVSGDVQSTFNGSGQIVSAGSQGGTAGSYQFSLTKVGGQWRISKPPPARRLLTVQQFADFYRSQDLYFTNPSVLPASPDQSLVPDSVFVPVGTPTTELVTNLVKALLPTAGGAPQSALLQEAAGTFPAGTSLVSVAQTGSTAIVDLGGLTKASTTVKEQVSAQLAWTLATPRASPPTVGAVQSVELELNGKPWIPPKSICGIRQTRSPVQNQATYACYNPYPSQPASFSFLSHGQVWSRCGSETSVQHGLVGAVVSVLHPASAADLACDGSASVLTKSLTTPASVQVPKIGPPSRAAVSPDGQYVAVYSPGNPDNKELSIGPVGSSTKFNYVPGIGSGVTALSWDRNDDLWVAENGDVFMVAVNGQADPVSPVPADVTDLSVAPDGVRIALIVQDGSTSVVDIAAIIDTGQSSQGQRGSPSRALPISLTVQVGPGLLQARSLAWYDADDLIVLAGASSPALWVVPVDGQAPSISQPAPIGADSITADGAMNALVAGISSGGGTLAVSTGIEGPWQPLGVPGQNPAYPG
ncbi:MAG TPA: LpqB family beta-propeller domain-containing protein [Streptosporangiaceae bacterium]|nr:LpqB family beta-propeller domain-containing protein [Streptosporangiaceae bacterium]